MKKNNNKKLIEGGLIGAALGIAAGIVLAPESKKIRSDIKKKTAEFHAYLAPHIKRIKALGETEYSALIHHAMKTYAKAKHLTASEGKDLVTHAKKSWKQVKKHAK